MDSFGEVAESTVNRNLNDLTGSVKTGTKMHVICGLTDFLDVVLPRDSSAAVDVTFRYVSKRFGFRPIEKNRINSNRAKHLKHNNLLHPPR